MDITLKQDGCLQVVLVGWPVAHYVRAQIPQEPSDQLRCGMQGSWCAGKGAGQAFRASMASQLPTMRSLASWLPEIILGTAFCKPLQVQLTCGLLLSRSVVYGG